MTDWNTLQEATLDFIAIDAARKDIRIELTCAGDNAGAATIWARGVEDFLVNEMRLTNVVDRVRCIQGAPAVASDSAAMMLFSLMQDNLPGPDALHWPPLEEKRQAIRQGDLTLVEIAPAYGASILVLAKEVQLMRSR